MLKRFLRNLAYSLDVTSRIFGRKSIVRNCTCCGYQGYFDSFGQPPRYEALCPGCGSLERHRLLALADQKEDYFAGKDVLHFAPEPVISNLIIKRASRYVTADFTEGRADTVLNIEQIDQAPASWDVVVCSHVLEHVDDKLALDELHRILRINGQLILMVPVIEGWETSYENPEITSVLSRKQHFGQFDHVRYYGRDIRDRLKNSGFRIIEFTGLGADSVEYGLMRGEKVFVGTKLF
jgi:SAM-dependent methyltransferase